MADVVFASREADARAAEAVEQHHAQLSGELSAHVEGLVAAVGRSDALGAQDARQRLAHWAERELVPHAAAEEETLYPAARRTVEGRLLVDAMLADHVVIGDLVRRLAEDAEPVRALVTAAALRAVFETHLAKENDQVLPLLLRTPGASVADLLAGMHELLGGGSEAKQEVSGGCGSGHTCTCGERDAEGYPELDARPIPHAIRHATIFGALDTVRPGSGLVLVAPHDPLPLIAQVDERWPGVFTVDYLQRGPEAWRLAFVREGEARDV